MKKNIYLILFVSMTVLFFAPKYAFTLELHATGAIFLDEEELAALPTTPRYRNYLPEAVDLSNRMPPIGDQGKQGSCVAWAVGYAARSYYEFASLGKSLEFEEHIASPAFIYDSIRSNRNDCNTGSRISDALNLLQNFGSMDSKRYVYKDRSCRTASPSDYRDELAFKIQGWARVKTKNLDQIKGELARGHPVIVSALVTPDFHYLNKANPVWEAGRLTQGEKAGGHAVTIVGYNDRDRKFKFVNSWGTDWAKNGYGYMKYETYKHRVRAAYVIRPENEPRKPELVEIPPPKPSNIETVDIGLPQYECSLMRAEERNSQITISGFVSSTYVLEALQEKYSKDYNIEVDVNPWPICEALIISENPGEAATVLLNSSTTQIGDDLIFTVEMPNFSSHLHLIYFQADGKVLNLYQSSQTDLTTYDPNTSLTLGDGTNGYPRFKISPPTGEEMILAVTTKSPLFTNPRPLVEEARDFLSAFRTATIDMERESGFSRYYAANYLAISIKDK